jgi:CheY-like chemotaxis protein
MGGDVTLESQLGTGTTFHVALPLDARSAATVAEMAAAAEPRADELVLLSVDDDPSVAPLLRKMLADHGYRVVAASGSRSVVADARRLQPSAILLDLLMPERGGEEVLAELKRDPATSGIPVILLSVVEPAEVPPGAEAHLAKPIRKSALLRALSDHRPAPEPSV